MNMPYSKPNLSGQINPFLNKKYQRAIMDKARLKHRYTLKSTTLENEDSVKLLGIKIDRDVTFKEQVANIYRKASLQLSVLK